MQTVHAQVHVYMHTACTFISYMIREGIYIICMHIYNSHTYSWLYLSLLYVDQELWWLTCDVHVQTSICIHEAGLHFHIYNINAVEIGIQLAA